MGDASPDLGLGPERTLALSLAVGSAMARALSTDEVAAAIFDTVVVELGGGHAALWLVDDDTGDLWLAGGVGIAPAHAERFALLPADAALPGPMAVRTRQPIIYGSVAERDARWPELASVETTMEATAVLPLVARERCFGCLSISFPHARSFNSSELALLEAVGEHCSLALDRARLYDAERAARETLEFLADATQVMVSASRPDDVLRALVRLAVPRVADSCSVYVIDGDALQRVAVEVRADRDVGATLAATARVPLDVDVPLVAAVRTGRLQRIDRITDDLIRRAHGERALETLRSTEFGGAMALPIVIRGEPVGAMTVSYFPGRDSRGQTTAVVGLAARAGVALDNARRFDEERQQFELLARALLPSELPTIPGFSYAARYVPASGTVCGDWYDVVPVARGRFVVGVGDAAGHGLPAAALMAELRNAARGLATAGRRPSQLLDDLRSLVVNDAKAFATALYAAVDAETALVEWSSAGHLPPLLASGSDATYLSVTPGRPLGAPSDASEVVGPSLAMPMRAGDVVVLYTDGVVERRDAGLDTGLARLRDIVAAHATAEPQAVADEIVRTMCQPHDDDCSILVLRRDAD